jgi:hypothetical protein
MKQFGVTSTDDGGGKRRAGFSDALSLLALIYPVFDIGPR